MNWNLHIVTQNIPFDMIGWDFQEEIYKSLATLERIISIHEINLLQQKYIENFSCMFSEDNVQWILNK